MLTWNHIIIISNKEYLISYNYTQNFIIFNSYTYYQVTESRESVRSETEINKLSLCGFSYD